IVPAPPPFPKVRILLVIPCTVCSLWSSPALSADSGNFLHRVRSLWSSPALSAVSGHPLLLSTVWSSPVLHSLWSSSCTVRSLWSSPVLSAVSGHLLYCPQSLVISCTVCSLW
ncbi:unnamed protein product, partial [Staurois parvus]